ncbi:myosin-11-like [Haliotis asinina]|uniref:myosin-11-like n=1 Tax=Haliotis asinina TaxID=109174 RepID=UPI0035325CC7
MSGETKKIDGHSPVNKYDLLGLEHPSLTEERIILAFQALDELVPQLGVFTRIFHKLRDDFFEAVYSEELTGSSEKDDNDADARYIQRIPYFLLVQRVYKERHAQGEELKEQLDVVKERLFNKHQQLEESLSMVKELQSGVDDLTAKISDLENTVAEKNIEIVSLEQRLDTTRLAADVMQERLEGDIHHLEDTLNETKKETEYLSKFKKGYDDLYDAFLEKTDEEEDDAKTKKRAVISTKRANLISQIECCSRLEQQLLTVLNTSMEEYDHFLEEHKEELETKVTTEDMTEAEFEIQEMEIEDADQQLQAVQERFQVTIGEMMTELGLLRQHNTMLMEQLQTLEENMPPSPAKREHKSNRLGTETGTKSRTDSILSAGLGENEMEETMTDPFIPQERVFSKYAAMIYTSNNTGKTFEEFKDAKYCPSCGEKTVVCPHRLGGSEKIFILPHNCTHIKITRPKVRINRELVESIMKPPTPDTAFDMIPSSVSQHQDSLTTPTGPLTPGLSRGGTSMAGGEGNIVNTMQAVWDDFRQRTNVDRTVTRPLDLPRTVSMMEQFLAFIVWQDDYGEEEDGYHSVLDNLYRFLTERYLVEEVVYLAAHDFLSAITEYSPTNKFLQLHGTVLSGNLDASCLRYVLLMCDYINIVDWKEVEDFRAFASAVYPFLGEDDLETLQMSYQSFSENRISPHIVSNFIIHIILKYREPRFLELENQLLPFQSLEGGHLTGREFKDALENILPLVNDRLRKRLFQEAEHTVLEEEDTVAVSIMRLAQISGYLVLCQITPIIKENVVKCVAHWRERPSSAGSAKQSSDTPSVSSHQALCMANVKNLASNVSRRTKHRNQRLMTEDHSQDFGEDW